jgi:ATP-dependent helicase HrpB
MSLPNLPIVEHLADIASGIQTNSISILQAPPGSGKTTVLPLYLAEQEWLRDRKILILQPRRLAARSVACRMSELLGQEIGQKVGYQIRLERKISKATKIEVITEGLLTRRILADPELNDVGLIIFDEFHERSLNADIGLVLSREVASVLRADLRILIMSATLDTLNSAPSLATAWRYSFTSKPHPVKLEYANRDPRAPIWEQSASAIRSALERYPGDLLAFLPGAFEIERCAELLQSSRSQVSVMPLYGELPYHQQQTALLPLSDGGRKVVLATNIAETSLTIEGVRIVVDAGLQKISRSEEAGITTLKTERITRDAAEQRAGRAGRTGPGVCIRLWSEQEHQALRPDREPEILRADITQQVLELSAWGVKDIRGFEWITQPAAKSLSDAINVLSSIKALHSDGSITESGKLMVQLGTHPRIGSCCLAARAHDLDHYAAGVIPLLEERVSTSSDREQTDISAAVVALAEGSARSGLPNRILELKKRWLSRLSDLPKKLLPDSERVKPIYACGFLLAIAFPDRIAKRRQDSRHRYVLACGKGACITESDALCSSEYIVVTEMRDLPGDSRVLRAVPLNAALFEGPLKSLLSESTDSRFDENIGVKVVIKRRMLGAIIIHEERVSNLSTEDLQSALIEHIRTKEGFSELPFSNSALSIQARCSWARRSFPNCKVPDLSSEILRLSSPSWIEHHLPENGRFEGITSEMIDQAFNELLPWDLRSELNEIAPDSIILPNGKKRSIDYSELGEPVIEATIQELFGLTDTPKIGRFQVPTTLRLLSPARRPMQVTRDLAGFWRGSYKEIRKELRGRYPKHKWPEDPSS